MGQSASFAEESTPEELSQLLVSSTLRSMKEIAPTVQYEGISGALIFEAVRGSNKSVEDAIDDLLNDIGVPVDSLLCRNKLKKIISSCYTASSTQERERESVPAVSLEEDSPKVPAARRQRGPSAITIPGVPAILPSAFECDSSYSQEDIDANKAKVAPPGMGKNLYDAAFNGDAATLKRLGRQWFANEVLNWPNKEYFGWTPLLALVGLGHLESIEILTDLPGTDVNRGDKDGQTPLSWAARNGHVDRLLRIASLPNVQVNKGNERGETALYWAAVNGHEDCVRALITLPGIDINLAPIKGSYKGRSPLSWAASNGHEGCVKVLVGLAGLDVNKASSTGETPLFLAAVKGSLGCVQALVTHPLIDVKQAPTSGTYEGMTPASAAAGKNAKEIKAILLAAEKMSPQVQPAFSSSAADPLAPYRRAYSPAEVAANKAKVAPEGVGQTLYDAAEMNDVETLKLIGEEWFANDVLNWPNKDYYGWTPLILAAHRGFLQFVKVLAALPGTDLNKGEKDGRTPLWRAAEKDQVECVALLLALPGIDINKPDINGQTPLWMAASRGKVESVSKMLALPNIDANKVPHYGHDKGKSALSATKNEEVKALLRASSSSSSSSSSSPPPSSSSFTDPPVARRKGYSPTEIATNKALTAPAGVGGELYNAADKGDAATLKRLGQQWFANDVLNTPNSEFYSWTPLHAAAGKGQLECLKILAALPGLCLNKGDKHGHTAIYWAAAKGRVECVKFLVTLSSIDVNIAPTSGAFKGRTPLSVADKDSIKNILKTKGAKL